MLEHHDLLTLVRSGAPLLWIDTDDETEVVESFRRVLAEALRPLYAWTVSRGLARIDLDGPRRPLGPIELLEAIKAEPSRSIYLLFDLVPHLDDPVLARHLRDVVLRQDSAAHTLALIGSRQSVPEGLRGLITVLPLAPPDLDALSKMLREEAADYARQNPGRRVQTDLSTLQGVARQLLGLPLGAARRIARHVIYDDGQLCAADLRRIGKLKFDQLDAGSVLRFEHDTPTFAELAGFERMKRWVELRKAALLGEPSEPTTDVPKGVLLLGVQGCGKSLAAKALAGSWRIPLLRLDLGAIHDKYHGETERKLREALALAERMAPTVLWLDEIEKAIATADSDGGVSRRVLGSLLTWMAERKARVFMVATANQVQHLPAELLRKGRFDEVFFVDLPGVAARQEVFRIHLERRRQVAERFDLDALARAAGGYSGAEIEQCVVAALYTARAAGQALSQQHLLGAIAETKPLSVLMAEPIDALRAWAAARTVPAHEP